MTNSEIIEGFKAVEFMRKERDRISNEIQGMNFEELQKYFEQRRGQLIHATVSIAEKESSPS